MASSLRIKECNCRSVVQTDRFRDVDQVLIAAVERSIRIAQRAAAQCENLFIRFADGHDAGGAEIVRIDVRDVDVVSVGSVLR